MRKLPFLRSPGECFLAPRDIAALAAFRFALGAVIAISAARFLAYGWVDTLFVRPTFHFTYWGLSWVRPLSGPAMHALFVAIGVLGACVALGFLYRLVTPLLFLAFTYVQLIDVANYLNHYYLVSLLLLLLSVIPAHRAFSIDAWRNPALRQDTLPAWCAYVLRFQVGVVYVFAALAKATPDWLLHAQPLQLWLGARTNLPVIGRWLDQTWVAYGAAWFGFLFDLTIVGFLMMRPTRAVAYIVLLLFHTATALLFPIGMFPVIMSMGALVFFDASWPRVWLRRFGVLAEAQAGEADVPRLAPLLFGLGAFYVALQLAIPLRTHLYGGNVLWHEQGMRFSWRVMAREKNGAVTFVVRQIQGDKTWHVSPRAYLNRLQEREMSVQPDLVLQLAHHIGADFNVQGLGPVAVFADATASLNGRTAAPLVDATVDLLEQSDGLGAKSWILAAPVGPPFQKHASQKPYFTPN
ncbi:MAG: HTTM domain-containing protein [Myxococcaceae bacterium]